MSDNTQEETLPNSSPLMSHSVDRTDELQHVASDAMPTTPSNSPRPANIYVYAMGHVEPRFPNLTVEREFAQVVGRYDTEGQTDMETMHAVLSQRENRYLVRQMCWLFSVERLPTYVLIPRDQSDWDLLVDTIRTSNQSDDLEVVVGLRGPLASPERCGGVVVPVVAFDQLYSFQRDDLLAAIPIPEGVDEGDAEQFRRSASELLDRIMQIADNSGSIDEHRALNYLSVRYPAIYATALAAHREEKSLSAVEVRPSRLGEPEVILNVVFSYTHRRTDVTEKYFVRVNVSGEFPFLVSKLQPYYER
ncbi:hypothetical protein AB0F72_28715 [Actinoplanes sp. NPDC023936]|uniref:cyanobactin maturation protease PatG family protein n=1 Tax=Actinoplanes sp. NPDC023936 TaxID=3154910 RepID=UPI0033C66BC8